MVLLLAPVHRPCLSTAWAEEASRVPGPPPDAGKDWNFSATLWFVLGEGLPQD